MQFLQSFKETYEKTARNDGIKPVQCFPTCRDGGHKQNVFCGASILIQCSSQQIGDTYVGHFRSGTGHFGNAYQKGEELCQTAVVARCSQDPFAQSLHILGKKKESENFIVEFLPELDLGADAGKVRQRRAWHYDWFVVYTGIQVTSLK
jgi:hypothetical protein